MMPTPSDDSLGLRGQAYGLLRTLLHHDVRVRLGDLVEAASSELDASATWLSRADVVIRVTGFLRHRLKVLLSRRFPDQQVHDALCSNDLCPTSLAESLERS
jgi:glycyl-tRNA synthetase beta subunit